MVRIIVHSYAGVSGRLAAALSGQLREGANPLPWIEN